MKRIGLTGTIASGKSYVADILEELGARVVDTDLLAREVVEPGTAGLQMIVERWGEGVLDEQGRLDRKKLADIVFVDEDDRRHLNSIVHPLVFKRIAELIRDVPPDTVVVLVVPLLFESGMDSSMDSVWVVTADEETLIKRMTDRDGFSREEALSRIRAQMPQEEKIKMAQVVIDNGGSQEDTRRQVLAEWNKLRRQAGEL